MRIEDFLHRLVPLNPGDLIQVTSGEERLIGRFCPVPHKPHILGLRYEDGVEQYFHFALITDFKLLTGPRLTGAGMEVKPCL